MLREYGFIITDETARASLRFSWAPSFAAVMLEWSSGEAVWSRREEVTPVIFMESEENRRRRKSRLAIHRLFEERPEILAEHGSLLSSWGILTGVRPGKMVRRFIDQGIGDAEIKSILAVEFGVEADRAELILRVCHNQAPLLPAGDEDRKRISLYIAYPFCPSLCEYCSFGGYEAARWRKWRQPCHLAMIKEISAVGQAASEMGFTIQTVYFGGGTPTCMSPESMDQILGCINGSFTLVAGAEWTVEGGRPETLTYETLETLASYPVTRICVNPQSMNQATLDRIGRKHKVEDVRDAIFRIRETASGKRRDDWRINCDLILGLEGEGLDDAMESVRQTLALAPDNITLHSLAIKRGSAYKEKQTSLPDTLLGRAMINASREMTLAAGYLPYYLYRQKESLAGGENVGYSLPGRFCEYNALMIEERQTILGLGAGAGSKFLRPGGWALDNTYNPKDLVQYIERVDDLIKKKVDKLTELG